MTASRGVLKPEVTAGWCILASQLEALSGMAQELNAESENVVPVF